MTDITDAEAAEVPRASSEQGDSGSGDAPEHLHSWAVLGVQRSTVPPVIFGMPGKYTIALIRCSQCGEPDTRTLPGEWTMEDLNKEP